jgi:putative ABC transport system ATP-binding protein
MYKLSGVTKDYQKGRQTIAALRGVDVVIEDRDWLAIQGPTGHGKSTLLQILGGLDRPTSGIVDFDGQDLAQLRETQLTRVRAESIGFVFQTFNLIPTLSAQENVEVALVPLGIHGDDRRARSMKAVASSSASPWPGPWSRSRRCCSPTSPPATWTRTPATRS